MKTLILAGGFGTRLAEETHTIPKPMLDVLVILFLLEKR
jgi:glucose-1-phosphate cytidylyltransferase